MRALILLAVACGGGSASQHATQSPTPPATGDVTHARMAEDDERPPSYDLADLTHAIDTERAAIAAAEQALDKAAAGSDVTTPDDPAPAADLAVRRRFLASLETCRDTRHACPPRLDESTWKYDPEIDTVPPLDTPLRFDLDDWRTIANELHGRACACRTLSCVDSVSIAIDQLEPRPMPDVRGDEAASLSITRARECLFRLRGKQLVRGRPEPVASP